MQSLFFKKLTTPILLSIFSILFCLQSSCALLPSLSPVNPPTSSQLERNLISHLSIKDAIDQYVESMKRKSAYQGPLQVDIVPGLAAKSQSIWRLMIPGSEYSVLAIPQGPLIFQKNLFKGKEPLDEILPFQVNDTTQRYTLHVQIQGDHQAQVSVNVNGTEWIRPSDFKGREAQINTLLLNKINLLRVRATGKPGASVMVSIIQAGEAGTVLKRKGYLHHPGQTQSSRIRQNDTNIFEPNAPDSLGGLVPYQGETKDSTGFYHGMMKVNQEKTPLEFQNGIIIFQRDPALAHKWTEIQSLYDLEILEESENRSLARLNLDKAPLENLANLLTEYSQRVPQSLTHLKFSSLQALQTFTIFLDLSFNHADAFDRIEFNGYTQMNQATPTPCNAPMPQDWSKLYSNLGTSWWLVDTHTASPIWDLNQYPNGYRTGAWDYSLGTGVKVAVIDRGFDTTHDEIVRRVRKGARYQNEIGIDEDNPTLCKGGIVCPNHGHDITLAGFAEKDNKLGTAGSAPNVEIIPLRHNSDVWSTETAFKIATNNNVDIISMSFGTKDLTKEWWTFGGFFAGQGMMDQITKAIKKGIIVFAGAGNDPNESYLAYIPANHPDVIAIGGLVIDPISTRILDSCTQLPIIPTLNVPFPTGVLKNIHSSGSNLVYGPGRDILVQKRKINSSNTPLESINGTSPATTFVAGIAALIKSRRPDITPAQMKSILQNAKGLKDITGTNHLIDAELALKNALGSNFPKASWYYALVEPDSTFGPNGHKLRLNKTVQTNASASEKEKKLPWQTISDQAWGRLQDGTLVKVRGWTGVPANASNQVFAGQDSIISSSPVKIRLGENQLELSEVESICPANACSDPGAFKPQLTKVTYSANPDATNGFELELEGQNLVADIRTGTNVVPIKLVFKHVKSTAPTPVTPLPGDKVVDISANQILDIRNDGTYVKLKVNPGQVSASFDYQIAFQSGITGPSVISPGDFASQYTQAGGGATGANFSVKAEGGTGSLTIQSIAAAPTVNAPPHISVWVTRDEKKVRVNPSKLVGIGIEAPDLSQVVIKIDDEEVPIREIAQNYISFGIPTSLTPGIKNVLIQLAGSSVTLEEAIEVLALPPLQEVQSLTTHAALGSASFAIDNQRYLAFANYYNGGLDTRHLKVVSI